MQDAVGRALGDPTKPYVLDVYLNQERRFAFVEFPSVELATACLALDGSCCSSAAPFGLVWMFPVLCAAWRSLGGPGADVDAHVGFVWCSTHTQDLLSMASAFV